jgi:hypothetical protein
MIDLNDFVPSDVELTVTDGESINDRGEIAGSGLLPNGDFHAIVLQPCYSTREPGCYAAGAQHRHSRSSVVPPTRSSSHGGFIPNSQARRGGVSPPPFHLPH